MNTVSVPAGRMLTDVPREVYIVTAYSWIGIWSSFSADTILRGRLFTAFDRNVNAGLLVYPPQVIEEIRSIAPDMSELAAWLRQRTKFLIPAVKNEHFTVHMREVLLSVPSILRIENSPQSNAEVLATARLLEGHGCRATVVSDDFSRTPRRTGVVPACSDMCIRCIPRGKFINHYGFAVP